MIFEAENLNKMFVGGVFCLFRTEQRKPIKILKSERTSLVIIDACFICFMAKDVLTGQHRGMIRASLPAITGLNLGASEYIFERKIRKIK